MSLGIDFEQYQFDRRLKELQDKVFSLNHRAPQGDNLKQMNIREPQNLNNQMYSSSLNCPIQQPYQQYIPQMQYFNPYQQYIIDDKSQTKKKEQKEEKQKQKNEQRQLELQKIEEQLLKKQELMILYNYLFFYYFKSHY